jgi:hypothetical protein
LLSGCALNDTTTAAPAQGSANAFLHVSKSVSQVKKTAQTLYILDGQTGNGINVYKDGGKTFLRTVQATPYSDLALAADQTGLLYVGTLGGHGHPGTMNIYSDQGSKLVRSFTQRDSFVGLAVDQQGSLYSLCPGANVCQRANAEPPITRKFKGVRLPLAVDLLGNLAALDCFEWGADACVFAPGETTPFWKITSGVDRYYVYQLAFDLSGNLYVVNTGPSTSEDPGNVAVFAPSAASPTRVITAGGTEPIGIAFDSVGRLYVYNDCGGVPSGNHCSVNYNSVTVYEPGKSTPFRTITDGVGHCDVEVWPLRGSCIAVDSGGDIYIANSTNQNVVEYRPGSDTPYRTITDSGYPVAVAVGP